MKNIHILPTDKPSRLYYDFNDTILKLSIDEWFNTAIRQNQSIYITNEEDIKDKCYVLSEKSINALYLDGVINTASMLAEGQWKKIILTTDPELIKDGVQAIDDEFLEWFVKNPLCDFVKVEQIKIFDGFLDPQYGSPKYKLNYKIFIPKEESKQESNFVEKLKEYFDKTPREQVLKDWEDTCKATEGVESPTVEEFMKAQKQFKENKTIEEAAEKYASHSLKEDRQKDLKMGFEAGAKWQQERMYSEEDMIDLVQSLKDYTHESRNILGYDERDAKDFVEIFLKNKTT